MKALTVPDLEAAQPARCSRPECQVPGDHAHDSIIGLMSSCCRSTSVVAHYVKGTGLLILTCASCREPVVKVAVALRAPGEKGQLH